tara:strand:+ start:125 stop:250 length:126 start_codon:yes stop_codon:yes gene_type:complete
VDQAVAVEEELVLTLQLVLVLDLPVLLVVLEDMLFVLIVIT